MNYLFKKKSSSGVFLRRWSPVLDAGVSIKTYLVNQPLQKEHAGWLV